MSDRLKRLREQATRPRRTVMVLLDGEVRGQIEAIEDEIERLDVAEDPADRRLGSKSRLARARELEKTLAQLREEAAESTLYLVVEGLPRTTYRAVLAQHPPRRDEQNKIVAADLRQNVNTESVQIPLARACIIGEQEKPEVGAKVLPLDESHWDGDEFKPGMVDFLLGYHATHPDDPERVAEADPFLTDRQIEVLANAALTVCRGDDAVPLPRPRSQTTTSDDG